MTAVIGVSAVAFIQNTPSAIFNSLEVMENNIYYAVEITDSSSLIVEDSLVISLRSNLDTQTQALHIGQNNGYFDSLSFDTNYQIEIKANYGFGIGILKSATIQIPSFLATPPLGDIFAIAVFGTMVNYQVDISQFSPINHQITYVFKATSTQDYYIHNLVPGHNEGVFDELSANLSYTCVVEANLNGVSSILDSETIVTGDNYAAKLMNLHQTLRSNSGGQNESLWLNSYQVDARFVDRNDEIASLNLKYASLNWQELTSSGDIPEYNNLDYVSIPFEAALQQFTLENLNSSSRIWLEIEAIIANESIILDTLIFDTPPALATSFYVSGVGPNYVIMDGYFMAVDFAYAQLSYTLELIQNNQVQRTITLGESDLTSLDQQMSSKKIVFNNLVPASTYHVRLSAHYTDALTNQLISEIIEMYAIFTTAPYTLGMTMLRDFNQIEITLSLDDQLDVFLDDTQLGYAAYLNYSVMTNDNTEYVTSGMVGFAIHDQVAIIHIKMFVRRMNCNGIKKPKTI